MARQCIVYTSTLRLLGRFTTCFAQTTTASRLLFALNGTSCLKNEKNWKFSILKLFSNFVPSRLRNNSLMSQHIWDFGSRFYLLWGLRNKHLCDFSHFQKCDNYVITPSNVWKKFQDSNLFELGQKYPHMPKISPGGLPVSSINSVHINIYTVVFA